MHRMGSTVRALPFPASLPRTSVAPAGSVADGGGGWRGGNGSTRTGVTPAPRGPSRRSSGAGGRGHDGLAHLRRDLWLGGVVRAGTSLGRHSGGGARRTKPT